MCPDELPDVPDFKLLCADGCYLFHPDDERAARMNAERVLFLPTLKRSLEKLEALTVDLTAQRDEFRRDSQRVRSMWRVEVEKRVDLETRLESSFDWLDLLLAGGVGVGVGAIAFLVGALAM